MGMRRLVIYKNAGNYVFDYTKRRNVWRLQVNLYNTGM